MPISFVYTTYESEESAKSISEELLRNKYIACYNIYPITSGYWWQDEIQNENEFVSIMKTSLSKLEELQLKYHLLHPYEVPCFVYWTISASPAYEAWIEQSLK